MNATGYRLFHHIIKIPVCANAKTGIMVNPFLFLTFLQEILNSLAGI